MEIKNLLVQLNETKASDLLLAGNNYAYLRINNSLQKIEDRLVPPKEVEDLVTPLIQPDKMEEFKRVKELDTSYQDEMARYRINLHYQMGSMGATIRRIPRDVPSLESLHLPEIVTDFANTQRGLILVTGPTGCGKSTTQAAMIDHINQRRPAHIITIEDPIEFVHTPKLALIEQREVGFDTDSFGEALKRALRQVPDVILVGEMRDLESIQMAITGAETGHIVISTLHTQDAVQSIDRVIDVFPPHAQVQIRTQLSMTLAGILSQQLLPRKDGKGLVGAYEILVCTSAIRNIIRKGSTQDIYSMLELGGQYKMITMDTSLYNLYKKDLVTAEEALNYAVNHEKLAKWIKSGI
ncbi:MAG: PilT/PilU family type 4a pilus ATPase [Candidatus Saganbacteria bacterium]|nr:PilT/PilU family type 4a pilus ATPase [Candidatus Saganbacteria bacterium]